MLLLQSIATAACWLRARGRIRHDAMGTRPGSEGGETMSSVWEQPTSHRVALRTLGGNALQPGQPIYIMRLTHANVSVGWRTTKDSFNTLVNIHLYSDRSDFHDGDTSLSEHRHIRALMMFVAILRNLLRRGCNYLVILGRVRITQVAGIRNRVRVSSAIQACQLES